MRMDGVYSTLLRPN